MVEKRLVINHLELKYKGIFDFSELIESIVKTVQSRGYKNHEKKFEERVSSTGKNIFIELRPVKNNTVYVGSMIKIRMEFSNLIDVVHEVDGIPKNFQQGDVRMTFDAWLSMLYNKRWGQKPWFYFAKMMVHRYVYRLPLEEGFVGEVASDTRYVYDHTKSLLNLYRYRVKPTDKVEAVSEAAEE